MVYHSNISISQSEEDFLAQPPESEPFHDAFVKEGDDTPGLHDNPSTTPTKRRHDRRFWRRIGKRGLVMISLGSLLLLASIAFLQFLWFQARKAKDGKEPHKLWQTIVFRDWLTRTVTVTAVLMRSVITAQAAIVTPMVAAMIVESSVHIAQLPILSVARAVNLSPTSLAMPSYTNARATSGYLCSLLVIAICLLTLGGQLISTLLLSDFQDTNIASLPISTIHKMALSSEIEGPLLQQFWTQAPQAFWRFAEHHVSTQKTTPNLVDTGVTLRAVIPWLDEKSRLDLSFYTGKAATWDARVVCFSPSLENVSFVADSRSMNIHGSLAYKGADTSIYQTEDFYVGPMVNCTTARFSSISVCAVRRKFTLDQSLAQTLGLDPHHELVNVVKPMSYLVFRLRYEYPGRGRDFRPFNIAFADDQTDAEWSIRRDGPWTVGFNSSGDQVFALSHCCTTPTMYYLNVTMNGTSGGSEPTIKLLPSGESTDGSIVADRNQVRPLRRQLGTTLENLTLQDRGLLSLNNLKTGKKIEGITAALSELGASAFDTLAFGGEEPADVHELHVALFEDIMHDTENPALALQAFSTTLNQMSYYHTSYRWTGNSSITYVVSKSMSIPVRRAGFIGVIAIVASHLGILVATSVLFIQRTNATSIGNPWQSIAQVISDETIPILTRLDGLEDHKDEEMPNVTGHIQRRQNGRTEFCQKQE